MQTTSRRCFPPRRMPGACWRFFRSALVASVYVSIQRKPDWSSFNGHRDLNRDRDQTNEASNCSASRTTGCEAEKGTGSSAARPLQIAFDAQPGRCGPGAETIDTGLFGCSTAFSRQNCTGTTPTTGSQGTAPRSRRSERSFSVRGGGGYTVALSGERCTGHALTGSWSAIRSREPAWSTPSIGAQRARETSIGPKNEKPHAREKGVETAGG